VLSVRPDPSHIYWAKPGVRANDNWSLGYILETETDLMSVRIGDDFGAGLEAMNRLPARELFPSAYEHSQAILFFNKPNRPWS
jgi:hypothetical protein